MSPLFEQNLDKTDYKYITFKIDCRVALVYAVINPSMNVIALIESENLKKPKQLQFGVLNIWENPFKSLI